MGDFLTFFKNRTLITTFFQLNYREARLGLWARYATKENNTRTFVCYYGGPLVPLRKLNLIRNYELKSCYYDLLIRNNKFIFRYYELRSRNYDF